MAIIPIHTALQNPDIVGNFQKGLLFGQQQRERKRLDSEREQLRGLAPGIQSGDPAAFGQAAAISPEYAEAQQKVEKGGIQRLKGAINFIEQAQKTGNPRAVEAAYQQVRPYLARFGQEPPATFAEAEPKFMEAKARIAMLDSDTGQSGVQSTYIDDKGQRIAVMRDGTLKPLGGADTGMSRQTITVTGPDGAPQQFTFDKRTGGYMPAQLGGMSDMGGQQVQQMMAADGQPIRVGTDLDPALIQQIQQNPQAFQAVPDQGMAQLPNVQRGPSPFVGQTPAQKAAQEAAARAQVELQYAPAMEQVRTQGAVTRAQQEAQIKQATELAGKDAGRTRSADDAISLITEARLLLPTATGGRLGAARDAAAGVFGVSTEGAKANAALKTIGGQLVAKMPRMEGPQSDRDVQMYKDMAGDIANENLPVETRLAALAQIERLQKRYASNAAAGSSAPRGTGAQAPVRVQSAQDYQNVPSGATYIAPDGTTRRKP